ncbi:MAG: hypothetical protein HOK88_00955 [Candidatus Marinimicrobia bacterium]|nr:hypothetical protein [Candidatus Neomarinimicrobiota bacterium]
MYQRLRDFNIPTIVLDEIFSNDDDLKTLEKSWKDLIKDGLNNDEVAESIGKVILDELGEEFIQSISDSKEK